MRIDASPLVFLGFILLPAAVEALWLAGLRAGCHRAGLDERTTRRLFGTAAALTVLWMVGTIALAASHVLLHFDWRPPPMLILMVLSVVLAGYIGGSEIGRMLTHLPLLALVGFQSFRIVVEFLMHRGFMEGFVPPQMTWAGWNYDIVTGLLAAGLGLLGLMRVKVPTSIVFAWNVLGVALLANVVIIAMLSMPTFRWFGPDRMNSWVAFPPYVWLPTVLVVAALAGHIVVFRALGRRT